MKLTASEVRHFKNVLWGTRFGAWFRWVLLLVLGYIAAAHFSGWKPLTRPDWLAAGAIYLLVTWPACAALTSFIRFAVWWRRIRKCRHNSPLRV